MIKKIKTIILTFIIAVATCISDLSVFAYDYPIEFYYIENHTILDDKGMLANDDYYKREGYKITYDGYRLYRAVPVYRSFAFILADDVNYEDVNDRINEIFREFYPEENYNDDEFVPSITAKTSLSEGITKYTSYFADRPISSANDERIIEAKKYSMDFMKKLNEENLISAFYDFGEVYDLEEYDTPYRISYSATADIDLVNEYINENNINCSIENVNDSYYVLVTDEDMDFIEKFNLAVEIYDATSVAISGWGVLETDPITIFGKNALESLPSSTTPAETTPTETTTTIVSTTVTTELTTEPTETTTSTAISTMTILPTATTVTTIPAITTTVTTPPTTTSLSELTTTTTTVTTITTPQPTEQAKPLGDADGDNELTVRDCSFIALAIAQGRNSDLSDSADFNKDGEVNVRDAAAIANTLAQVKS